MRCCGLIASAVSPLGSVDNINAIISGPHESGFAQSDVDYWASVIRRAATS